MEAAAPKNEAHRKCRENWLHELTKSRVVGAELKFIRVLVLKLLTSLLTLSYQREFVITLIL